jgi:hypothetical protein
MSDRAVNRLRADCIPLSTVLCIGRHVWSCCPRIFLEGMKKFLEGIRSVKFENAVFGIRTNHSCHPIKSNLRVSIFKSLGIYVRFCRFLTLSLPKQYTFSGRLLLRVRENSQRTRCWPQASSLSRYVILSNIGVPCCVLYTITAIIMANILIGLGAKPSLERGLC